MACNGSIIAFAYEGRTQFTLGFLTVFECCWENAVAFLKWLMVVVDWLTDCCKELAEVTQKDWTCYLFFWLSSQTFFTSYSRSRHISLYRVHWMKHWCASSVPRPLSQTMWSPHQFCIDGLWAANHLVIIWLSLLQCICLSGKDVYIQLMESDQVLLSHYSSCPILFFTGIGTALLSVDW